MSYEFGFDLAKRLHDSGEKDLKVDLSGIDGDYRKGFEDYVKVANYIEKD